MGLPPTGWTGVSLKLEHTLYDVLEVTRHASPVVVKAAYRSLAHSLHPDKHSGTEASGHRLAEINDAYAVLSDPARRMHYDRTLALKDVPVERRRVDGAWGSRGFGPVTTGNKGSRPFGFRPLT